MRRPVLLALSLAGCAVVLGAQQQAPPTFRGGIDIVHIDVSVLDKTRQPVRDLTAGDFTVLENGKVRPVVAFTSVDLPRRVQPTAPWMSEIGPDVLTNVIPREGRLIVIFLDRSITDDQRKTAAGIARAAVDQLRPGDLAAVVYSGWGMPQNFTADRKMLLSAIDQPLARLPAGDAGGSGDCYCGACSLGAMADIAETLGTVPQRRKVLLAIWSNVSLRSNGLCGGALEGERMRLQRAADVANLTINSFDPSGPATYFDQRGQAPQTAANRGRQIMANLLRQGNLAELPDRTGGRTVFGDGADQVSAVLSESSSYYVLGVEPTAGVKGLRELNVRVNRRDVSVQARRGYYPSGGEPRRAEKATEPVPALLTSALVSLWPKTDIPISISALPIALPGLRMAVVSVIVGVRRDAEDANAAGGSRNALSDRTDSSSDTSVDVVASAFDRNGRSLASRHQTFSVSALPGAGPVAEYEVLSRLTLAPGRYEIRTAVEDGALGRSGSAYTYVDVPNFLRDEISLSGLLVEAKPFGVSAPTGAMSDLVPVVPTARRDFWPTDRVRGFVRIYEGTSTAVMPVYVIARLLDENDQRVFQQETRVPIDDFRADRTTDFAVDLPLESLRPGEYLLTINVSHGNTVAQRDVRFRVRP